MPTPAYTNTCTILVPEYLRLRASIQSLQVTWEKFEASGTDADRLAMQNELVGVEEQLVEYDKTLSSEAVYAGCKTNLTDALIFASLEQAINQAGGEGIDLGTDGRFLNTHATQLQIQGQVLTFGLDLSLIRHAKTVTTIWISHCDLLVLPELPLCLRTLICSRIRLVDLPPLPPNLTELECNDNELLTLPELPEGLIELSCSKNKLAYLPKLPKTLRTLDCKDNLFTDIPELPDSLTYIDLRNNRYLTASAKEKLEIFKNRPGATVKY
jgi:hypothetical protein